MSGMVEVKTADLAGVALDWAVAQAEGRDLATLDSDPGVLYEVFLGMLGAAYRPSSDWSQGGPLIDVYQVEFSICDTTDIVGASMFCWKSYGKSHRTRWSKGETHLIAACRAIVSAKLGDTVSVPRELMP